MFYEANTKTLGNKDFNNTFCDIECICDNNNYLSKTQLIQCFLCHKYQHISCIFQARFIKPYICFNCQFKNNHFYLRWKKTILPAKEVIYSKKWAKKPNLLKTTPQLSSLQFPPLQLKVPESIANSSWYKTAKLKSDVNNIGKQWDQFKGEMQKQMENPNLNTGKNINKIGLGNQAIATGIDLATDQLSGIASNKLFGDSELGRGMGTLFSQQVIL